MQDDPRDPRRDEPAWPERDLPPEAEAHQPVEPPNAASARPDAWPGDTPATHDAAGARDTQAVETAEEERRASSLPSEAESFDRSAAAPPPAAAAHTVPPTDVGENTRCPRCGTENRPGISFCRSCGQRLMASAGAPTVERPGAPEGTQACPRCGTHNRAGAPFCQNCGASMRAPAPGYVPPSVEPAQPAAEAAPGRRGAVLGPIVLLIAVAGLVVGWLLPFTFGTDSLFDRAFGPGGYGVAFWAGYDDVGASLPEQAYFGFAGPVLLLAALLVILAVAGFIRAAPRGLQTIGLVVALVWAIGLAALFVVVEVGPGLGGDLLGMLRNLTAGGIILFLASLIALIGILTRFARG